MSQREQYLYHVSKMGGNLARVKGGEAKCWGWERCGQRQEGQRRGSHGVMRGNAKRSPHAVLQDAVPQDCHSFLTNEALRPASPGLARLQILGQVLSDLAKHLAHAKG